MYASKAQSQPTDSVPVQRNKNAYTALKETTWKFDIGKIRNKFAFHVLHALSRSLSLNLTLALSSLVWYSLVGFWWLKTFIIPSLLDASAIAASSCFLHTFFCAVDGRISSIRIRTVKKSVLCLQKTEFTNVAAAKTPREPNTLNYNWIWKFTIKYGYKF